MERRPITGAISCESIRRLLHAFACDELDAEQGGRVRGHLLSCEPCALAFGDTIAEVMQGESLGAEAMPPMPAPPDSVLESTGVRHPSGGRIWVTLQSLAQADVAWAKEAFAEVRKAVQRALLAWALTQATRRGRTRGIRTRSLRSLGGPEGRWPATVDVEILDSDGQRSGHTLRFAMVVSPTITHAGQFVLGMRTEDAGLAGAMLLCTLEAAEGVLVTFTGALQPSTGDQGGQVAITADGLPSGEEDVVVPPQQVRLVLQRSNHPPR